jgi:hypothetical protein
LKLVNRFHPLRVSAEHEDIGLNLTEHGEADAADISIDSAAQIDRTENARFPSANQGLS